MVTLDPPRDGFTNMARDEALLLQAEHGAVVARVYSWDGPWVSLGKFQNPERDLLPGTTVPHVRRPTGGKAVLHGHDATIALAMPLASIDCTFRDVKRAYRAVIEPITKALNLCGLAAVLAEETSHVNRGRRTADCFAFNSANDVVDPVTGQKLCGCALKLTDLAVLVQASIPNGHPLVDPKTVLREASLNTGPEWDASHLRDALEQSLRYNFDHVSA